MSLHTLYLAFLLHFALLHTLFFQFGIAYYYLFLLIKNRESDCFIIIATFFLIIKLFKRQNMVLSGNA